MKKHIIYFLFLFVPMFLFGQLDPSIGYLKQQVARMQEKMGVLGTDSLLSSTEIKTIVEDTLNTYTTWIKPGYSDAYIQSLVYASGGDSIKHIKFQQGGVYDISGFTISNAEKVTIDGNGSTLDLNGGAIQIWSQDESSPAATDYILSLTSSDFVTNIIADSFWVGVNDTADFEPISRGDIIIISDSTQGTTYRRGMTNFFRKFDVVEGQQRIYFENPAYNAVSCADSLYYVGKVNLGKSVIIKNLTIVDGRIVVRGVSSVGFDNYQQIATLPESLQPSNAVDIGYCRYFYFNNVDFNNPINVTSNLGSGIVLQYFDRGFIHNFSAHNSRHPLNVQKHFDGYSNYLALTNVYVSYSGEYWQGSGGQPGNAFTVQHQINQVEMYNVNAKGANALIENLGTKSLKVNGGTWENCVMGVLCNQNYDYFNYELIDLNNITAKKLTTAFVRLGKSNGVYNVIRARNLRHDNRNSTAGISFISHLTTADSIQVDSIICDDMKSFNQLGSDARLFSFSSTNTYGYQPIKVILCNNVELGGYEYVLFQSDKPIVQEFINKNVDITNCEYFSSVDPSNANDTTNVMFNKWILTKSRLKNVKYLLDFTNDDVRFGELRIINNEELTNVGIIDRIEDIKADVIDISNNNWTNAGYAAGSYSFALSPGNVNEFYFNRNTVRRDTSLLTNVNSDYKLTEDVSHGFFNFAGASGNNVEFMYNYAEDFYDNTYIVALNTMNVNLQYNIINPEEIATSGYIGHFNNCVGDVLNNTFYSGGAGNKNAGIRFTGASSNIKVSGNHIIQKDGGNIVDGIQIDGGTVRLGLNTFEGSFTNRIDTTGVAVYDSMQAYIGTDELSGNALGASADSDYVRITIDTLAGKTGNTIVIEDTLVGIGTLSGIDSLQFGSGSFLKGASVVADSAILEIGAYQMIIKSDSTAYIRATP